MISPEALRPFLATTLESTDFHGLGEKYVGKVRDVYQQKAQKRAILIATDRQSAFDINWCSIPLKGQVLNELSAWWFQQVASVMPNHVLALPDPNAMVVKSVTILPVEIVVRSYLTGSTGTSVWVNYLNGVRDYCGNQLPEGMVKNQKLWKTIVTPTTKGEHDELVSPAQIIERGLATKQQWEEIESKALALFAAGQKIAAEKGLILVDTKYEMGYDTAGTLTIADEVHTPDSSRYWIASTYEKRFADGLEPEGLDKEFFRLWLREQGFEYGGKRPEISDDVRCMLGSRYIQLYERMTGQEFKIPSDTDVKGRIERNLKEFAV